jgi:hypothetical protein
LTLVLDRRRRDHERIDRVPASRVPAEGVALERAGGRRTALDRLIAPVNRQAARTFLQEARRKVWLNATALNATRLRGPDDVAHLLAALEEAAGDRCATCCGPAPCCCGSPCAVSASPLGRLREARRPEDAAR